MRLILFAAAAVALASPAFADSWTAEPVQPAKMSGFVASSLIWNCDGAACRAVSETMDADELSECRGLAREVGPLSSFTGHKDAFAADRLAKCNQSARKTTH